MRTVWRAVVLALSVSLTGCLTVHWQPSASWQTGQPSYAYQVYECDSPCPTADLTNAAWRKVGNPLVCTSADCWAFVGRPWVLTPTIEDYAITADDGTSESQASNVLTVVLPAHNP